MSEVVVGWMQEYDGILNVLVLLIDYLPGNETTV